MTKFHVTKKLLLIGVGLLLGLILAEVVLRVHEGVEARRVPQKTYRNDPGAPGTIRMAILGGSTSNGEPYSAVMGGPPEGRFNLLSVTRFLLEKRLGCPGVEVDNYAGSGWSAETTVDHYFERPGPKPDILVFYTGQNETTRYYSPNMLPPSAFLAPLARLKAGSLLLRRLYTRQVAPDDQRYTGKFFSDNIIPPYEREHNVIRFRRYVERMIRYADTEGIVLVIVIPQGNYLFPPTRSVYRGPAGRKAEALGLFRKAWQARHVDNDPERAWPLLEQLLGFCSFADLYFELGELHDTRGDSEAALPYLRRARETDGFPTCITPEYREVLLELADQYSVPSIDMDDVIRNKLGRPMPDYQSFLDDCHLRPDVCFELSRQLIRILRQLGLVGAAPPLEALGLTDADWADGLGLSPRIYRRALAWEARYHLDQAGYTFLKRRSLDQARRYVREVGQQNMTDLPAALAARLAGLDDAIRADHARMLEWFRHDGAMPIGTALTGPPPEGFGDDVGIELSQGDALMKHGQVDLAIAHYRRAMQLAPESALPYNNLGNALHASGRTHEAILLYREALQVDPANAKAHYDLGNALQALGKLPEAVEEYRQALRLKPDYAKAHNNLGNAMKALGRPEEALRHYREALRVVPDYAEVLYNLGRTLQALGRPREAVTHYQQALRLQPDFADAHYNLGNALAAQGRPEEATACYRQALRLNPDHVGAHNNLGSIYRQSGRLAEAIEHLEQAVRLKPDSAVARENLRITRERLGEGSVVEDGM